MPPDLSAHNTVPPAHHLENDGRDGTNTTEFNTAIAIARAALLAGLVAVACSSQQ